jgi:hypothetical protein
MKLKNVSMTAVEGWNSRNFSFRLHVHTYHHHHEVEKEANKILLQKQLKWLAIDNL